MRLDASLSDLGAELTAIEARRRRWAIQARWRDAFAPEWHDWSGAMNDRDWHVFSYHHARHLHGAAAVEAFELELAAPEPVIVATSLATGPMFVARFVVAPTYVSLSKAWRDDLYLFSNRLRWTFVMTHETGLGPYFARGAGEGDAIDETGR
jgi:Domain of unknown function (DUF4275)